jgi:hypothetical protein
MFIKQLFISGIPAEFSLIELFDIFYTYQIATISEIYYNVQEIQGELYNDLYITITKWHNTKVAHNFIRRLQNSYATFIYDDFDELSCKVYILNHAMPSNGHLLTNCYDIVDTNTSPIYLEKQLLINKLLNNKKCFDLHHDIKEYLFVDSIYSESRIKKKSLILNLDQSLTRLQNNHQYDGYWELRYGYDIQLSSTQCITCGGFEFIAGPGFQNVAPRALCCCPGFREFYLEQIANFNEPLLIFD